MALTTEYANQILSNLMTNAYIGLSITAPNASGGNVTEPSSGANYSRVPAAMASFKVANKTISNEYYVYFPEATESWGTITHLCVFSKPGVSSGQEENVLRYYGALNAPVLVNANSVPLFRPGTINISMDA